MITKDEAKYFAIDAPRAMGTEREYGLQIHDIHSDTVVPIDSNDMRDFYREVKKTPDTVWVEDFSNMGKTYLDMLNLEHASNEFTNINDMALAYMGADLVVVDALHKYMRRRAMSPYLQFEEQATLSLRSSDDVGGYFGGLHLNMAIPKSLSRELFGVEPEKVCSEGQDKVSQLAGYLVTSSLVIGAGSLWRYDSRTYSVHPFERMHASCQLWNNSTTTNRPIVNSRLEPLSTSNVFERLHTISLDAHIRPVTTAVQAGCLSAFVRCLEYDLPMPFWLAKPLSALGKAKVSPSALQEINAPTGASKKFTAYELFASLVERMHAYAVQHDFPAQEQKALAYANAAVTNYLEDGPYTNVTYAVMPWLRRRNILRETGLLGRQLTPEDVLQLRSIDRTFDSYKVTARHITPGAHLAAVRSPELCKKARQAVMTPSTDTRAASRVNFIESIPENRREQATVTWESASYTSDNKKRAKRWNRPTPTPVLRTTSNSSKQK